MLISQSKVCQDREVKKGDTCLGFLTGDLEDIVIPDVMDDVFLPKGRYPENFVLISQLEEGQEGRVKKEGTWRTLRVPDQRHGGLGHSRCHE